MAAAARAATPIYLPADMVRYGTGVPAVCPRHGLRGGRVQTTKLVLYSRTPGWVWLFLLLSLLIAVVVAAALRKSVRTKTWPACETCRRMRRSRLTWAWVLVAAWLPAVVLSANIESSGWLAVVAVFAFPLAALVMGSNAGWSVIAKAYVTRDGAAVVLDQPSPDFVNALPPVPPTFGGPGYPSGGVVPTAPPTQPTPGVTVVVPPWEQG